jgi:hypothetical protein
MKASIPHALATLMLTAALGPVSLMAQGPINVKIPFDFAVGSKSLAAGDYRVRQQAPYVLAIESADGRSAMVIMTVPAEGNDTPGFAKLTFHKYGDLYFLSQVSENGRGLRLPPSRVENELIAKKAPAKPVVLAAGH